MSWTCGECDSRWPEAVPVCIVCLTTDREALRVAAADVLDHAGDQYLSPAMWDAVEALSALLPVRSLAADSGRSRAFRKKPVEIAALQWTGDSAAMRRSVHAFVDAEIDERGGELKIKTLEGWMHVSPGDWIIKGVAGEFYPCKPDIFEATYEAVDA